MKRFNIGDEAIYYCRAGEFTKVKVLNSGNQDNFVGEIIDTNHKTGQKVGTILYKLNYGVYQLSKKAEVIYDYIQAIINELNKLEKKI